MGCTGKGVLSSPAKPPLPLNPRSTGSHALRQATTGTRKGSHGSDHGIHTLFLQDVTHRTCAPRAQIDLNQYEKLLTRLSCDFVGADAGELDALIGKSLGEVCVTLALDRASVWRYRNDKTLVPTHAFPEGPSRLPAEGILADRVPWLWSQLAEGRVVLLPEAGAFPPEAAADADVVRPIWSGPCLFMPLRAGGQIVGALAFGARNGAWIRNEELTLRLRFMGSLVAAAFSRQRTHEALLERLEFEEVLSDLSQALSSTTSDALSVAINQVQGRICRLLRCHRGGLLEFSEDGECLTVTRVHLEPGAPALAPGDDTARPWYREALRKGRTLVLRRPLLDLPEEALEARDWVDKYDIGSHVAIPISVRNKIVGALAFESIREPRDWSDALVTRLGVVGEMIANAIDWHRSDAAMETLRRSLAHASRVLTAGELTAALAHELNQPLTAILSNALAGRRLLAAGKSDLQEIDAILADVMTETDRASAIIRHLRNYVRRGAIDAQPVDVGSAVADVGRLMASEARLRHVDLTVSATPCRLTVLGDRVQLQQIVVNLTLNALEALEGVTGRRREVHITCQEGEDQVVVTVDDTGPGLPREGEQVFEVFHTTKAHGMGVGLSLARTIARAHGGHLRVVPKETPGARFELVLPAG